MMVSEQAIHLQSHPIHPRISEFEQALVNDNRELMTQSLAPGEVGQPLNRQQEAQAILSKGSSEELQTSAMSEMGEEHMTRA